MSFFGASSTTGTGLFGSTAKPATSTFGSTTTQQPAAPTNTGCLFGSTQPANNQQQGSSLFGGFGQTNQQQQQQNGGLFSGLNQNNQQQQSGGLFGNTQSNQQSNQQSNTGLFGQTQSNSAPTSSLFGQNTQNQTQNSQQTQQLPQLNQSMYTPAEQADTSIPGQIQKIQNQWDTGHPDCAFRVYFYNKVDPNNAPYYRPTPREDPKAWETALSQKPGSGYIPVLCVGFKEMSERITAQTQNLASFNLRLHEINNSLEAMLAKHDLVVSIRALDARRRHTVLKQRAMQLASKVQILRNRGYALGGDEEDLKTKLQILERGILDPGLGARGEEIWARMVGVRERAKLLREEVGRRADANGSGLDEDTARRAEKILEDYGKQLGHLKRELALVTEDLKAWEKDQPLTR